MGTGATCTATTWPIYLQDEAESGHILVKVDHSMCQGSYSRHGQGGHLSEKGWAAGMPSLTISLLGDLCVLAAPLGQHALHLLDGGIPAYVDVVNGSA